MTERIKKAIDIFLDAINEGTLAKGTCRACAVGNLVAHGLEGKITINENNHFSCSESNIQWRFLFITDEYNIQNIDERGLDNPFVQKNIEATDFTWKELAQIEYAFETNSEINFREYRFYSKKEIRADQIKGLEAVIKVMLTFDESKEDVKEVFTKRAELIPLTN